MIIAIELITISKLKAYLTCIVIMKREDQGITYFTSNNRTIFHNLSKAENKVEST
ncbi:hypothetical protein V6M85_07380 [Sulfolobus tengchongensis]|uniref:Uncharacterized protein n=1 Tax=Sulfolobus tengchongensis TaxID=207809 RepID=A0AAX4KZ80_9CREN